MPEKKVNKRLSAIGMILYLMPYLWVKDWKMRLRILISILCMICMIFFNLGLPLLFKKIISILSGTALMPAVAFISVLLIAYGLIWTLSQIVAQIRTMVMYRVLERSERFFSMRIFDHLHRLSLRYHLEKRTGTVTNAIERAYNGFDNIFWGLLLFMIPTCVEILLAISILFYLYGYVYSIGLFLLMIAYLIFTIATMPWAVKGYEQFAKKRSHSWGRIVDSLINFETVKYFNNQNYEHVQCEEALKELEDFAVARYIRYALIQLGQAIILGLGLTFFIWRAGNSVVYGAMNVSDFVLISGYILQFIGPLNHFGYILTQIRKGLNDMQDSIELLALKPEIKDSPDAIDLHVMMADVVFEHVDFWYDKRRPILRDISFRIPAGKTVAIVGPTGSGKSTIARLILRFYDVTGGQILLNGHDIRTITQQSLHAAIAIVPQDTTLFNNTLYYNVAYGRPTASKAEVERALSLAHLDALIKKLPEGYDTLVGERGLKLSGGEKQRLAIARAILKNPAMYIFDEATAALDVRTEREIQENIRQISQQVTSLIIAHRLSTIVHANSIIVLDHGHIIEQGTHRELLKNEGLYARLWNKQLNGKKSLER